MDFDQLVTFVAVAELGNFSRAAEKVLRTQPAISAQIRKLEEENRRLQAQLESIQDRLRKLKKIPACGLPEHVTVGPEFIGFWAMLPLFSRSILRGVLGEKSKAVIDVLDELYSSAGLPVSH